MIRGLVFDFDGLILDTEVPVYRSWLEIYQAYGCQLSPDVWSRMIGTADNFFEDYGDLEQQLGYSLDHAYLEAKRTKLEFALVEAQSIRPGIKGYLETARRRGLRIGLATSSSCRWVTGHITRLGLVKYFDSIVARDDVRYVKPDPELYRMALSRLGLKPDEAISFEDSPNGARAAKGAGLFCVVVPNPMTSHLEFEEVDLRLASLADLPLEELIARVECSSPV